MALYYNIYKGDRIKTSAEVRQKSISFVIVTKYMTNSAELIYVLVYEHVGVSTMVCLHRRLS